MTLDLILIFDWYDGPTEGIVANVREKHAWYFKVCAERAKAPFPNDRLFGLWVIPESDAALLVEEFGGVMGALFWPTEGGLGSEPARRTVEHHLQPRVSKPDMMARSQDFADSVEVWRVL